MTQGQPEMPHQNHVLGVVQDPRTDTLATDLRSAGFQEFTVLSEEVASRNAGERFEEATPAGRVIEEIKSNIGEDAAPLHQYEDAARSGSPLVAVKVGDEAQAQQAGDVLQRNHVKNIHYFSREGVRELRPENP